jgi:hypothetical protein
VSAISKLVDLFWQRRAPLCGFERRAMIAQSGVNRRIGAFAYEIIEVHPHAKWGPATHAQCGHRVMDGSP